MADALLAPAIGVIVLNWNSLHDTLPCLDSLRTATPRPRRVVIVDNLSRDDEVSAIEAYCRTHGEEYRRIDGTDAAATVDADALPWLVLVKLGEHRGFAGGNNVGLRVLERCADVTHFLLLNNDTEVAPAYFAHLAEALQRAPEAALLSGTIYHWDERDRVWWAGGTSVPWRALVLHQYHVPADPTPRPTEFITGCALVISRPALRQLGYLPECYFPVYVEDAEYSYRARCLGLPVLYAPAPVLYHKIGATLGRASVSPRSLYLDVRHRVWYVRRNFTGAMRLVALGYLAATKPGRAAAELLRGRPAMASAVLRGIMHGLFGRGAWAEHVPGTG